MNTISPERSAQPSPISSPNPPSISPLNYVPIVGMVVSRFLSNREPVNTIRDPQRRIEALLVEKQYLQAEQVRNVAISVASATCAFFASVDSDSFYLALGCVGALGLLIGSNIIEKQRENEQRIAQIRNRE